MQTDQFEHLDLSSPILRALTEEGYQRPTDIQQATIPKALAGRDVLATAQTGTGKTAAFALPTLQLLHERHKREERAVRALVLTPTRELALQIDESFRAYGRTPSSADGGHPGRRTDRKPNQGVAQDTGDRSRDAGPLVGSNGPKKH